MEFERSENRNTIFSDANTASDDFRIDDYDPYDPIPDQLDIDNYSAIKYNMSRLKRFLGWMGFTESADQIYKIADMNNLELYNLDDTADGATGDSGDIVMILKKEKQKRFRKIMIRLGGSILIISFFFYIVFNLALVNKEYTQIKNTHAISTTTDSSIISSTSSEFYTSLPTSFSITNLILTSKISATESKSSFKPTTKVINTQLTKPTSKTTNTKKTKSTSTKTKTTKTKTSSKTIITATHTAGSNLLSHLNDFWDEAKEMGETLKEEVENFAEVIGDKIQKLGE
ncbi:hypothetical protein QEN19_003371 [Hanseniaspora menglaensis]